MLVSRPTRRPVAIGDMRKLIVAAKNPSEKRDAEAARRAVRLSGNERGSINSGRQCQSKNQGLHPTSRGIANLPNGHSASRWRTRKLVGGFEPRGELSIEVRGLLRADLEVPTVAGRLLPLLNARAPDVGSGIQREDEQGTPRRDAGKCGVAYEMYRGLLALFRHRAERACGIDEPLV